MKLATAALIAALLGTADGFNPSVYPASQQLLPRSPLRIAADDNVDAYASLQDKLLTTLSSTLESANHAVIASSQLDQSSSRYNHHAVNSIAENPSLQLNLPNPPTMDNSDMNIEALYNSLTAALDISSHAATQASHSYSELVQHLIDFNLAMSHYPYSDVIASLDMSQAYHAHLADIADRLSSIQLDSWKGDENTLLLNYLGSLDRQWDDVMSSFDASSSEMEMTKAGLLMTYGVIAFSMGYAQNNERGQDYKEILKQRMEEGTFDVNELASEVGYLESSLKTNPSAATVASLPTVSVDYDAAARLAYKSAGKLMSSHTFKKRYLIETSKMVAAKNPYVNVADNNHPLTFEKRKADSFISKTSSKPVLVSVDYDAAARLAYNSAGKLMPFRAFKKKYILETSRMVAAKNPYLAANEALSSIPDVQRGTTIDYDAAIKLAYEESAKLVDFTIFRARYLIETSSMVAKKNPYVQIEDKPLPPIQDITTESFMKQPMVQVVNVAKKMMVEQSTPKKSILSTPASPLARLLAAELGLDLTNIGKGSGKNGKILIEDVRAFQRKIEKAKDVIAKKQPYFATVNA